MHASILAHRVRRGRELAWSPGGGSSRIWAKARRLAESHGQHVRFYAPWKRWLLWDGTCWLEDRYRQIMLKVRETARTMRREGLCPTDEVRAAVQEYREEMDIPRDRLREARR